MLVAQPPAPGAAMPPVETGGFERGGGVEAPDPGAVEARGGALVRGLPGRGSVVRYGRDGRARLGRGVHQHEQCPKSLGSRRVGFSACKAKIRISQLC